MVPNPNCSTDKSHASVEALAALEALASPRLLHRFADIVGLVGRFPAAGHRGRVLGTREYPLPPFVVVYRVLADRVEIAAIVHGAREH